MQDLESELLKWAGGLDIWQQDLLRRISQGESISIADYRVYADQAERIQFTNSAAWFQVPEDLEPSTFLPLNSSHLRATSAGTPAVSIKKITHVEGANDLTNGAVVEFKETGLTIVAGRNGSGKSGYTRILKQVAASRGPERVLPNAFKPDIAPRAVITYQIGSDVAQDLTWQAGAQTSSSPLQRVRVFDARSATIHLAGSTEIAYVPPTLQILAEYTTALRAIGEAIADDVQRARLRERTWPNLQVGTALEVFEHLGEQSGLDALRKLAALTEVDLAELDSLPAQLQALSVSDPAKFAIQARSRASQLSTLARNLGIIASGLDGSHTDESRRLRDRVVLAEITVAEASKQIGGASPLPTTGSAKWRALWAAAKEFVEGATNHEFPDLNKDAICALCQQPLESVARERFEKFADFMKGEAQIELDQATQLRGDNVATLMTLPLTSVVTQDLVDLVSTYSKETGEALLPLFSRATVLRDWLIEAEIPDAEPEDAHLLSVDINTVASALNQASEVETQAAAKLGASDSNALEANRLQLRVDELQLRQELSANLSDIGAQHDLTIRIAQFEAALKACDTTAASKENTKLSQDYVDKVCAAFALEAKALGLDRVPVELIFDKSSRGISYIRVNLVGAPNIPVATVLSEGEQRVTAIAGFFADLTEAGDESTLVFDDPVSSLDQVYREAVARRLLTEAQSRQVLVFSHDFTFVQYLFEQQKYLNQDAATRGLSVTQDIEYLHIARGPNGAGSPTTAEEWRHVSVKERIKRLNERVQNAGVLFRNNDIVAYEKEARDIVGGIRETWECFVEQELLDGVIQRHERAVQTKRLKKLTDIVDTDVAAVDEGMTITSRMMTGHDTPSNDGTQMKNPEWLTAELKKLDDFRKSVLDRRKK